MIYKRFKDLLFLFAILFMPSCTSLSDKNRKVLDEKFGKSDTLVKELPKNSKGEISNLFVLKELVEKPAGFESLENGFDSIKMRFWYNYATTSSMHVIEIENSEMKWTASQYTIKCVFANNYESMICSGKTVIHNKPKSGWEKLIQELFRLNILTLTNFESYYAQPMDAALIGVEIATKNRYRYYFYSAPLYNQNFPSAKNMVEIMDLLEYEFNFKRIERF